MAWAKFTSFNGLEVVSKKTSAFPQYGYELGSAFVSGQKAQGILTANANARQATGTTFGNLSTSTWYLFVMVYDAAAKVNTISVNGGAFDSSTAGSAVVTGDTAQFQIGSNAAVSGYMNGRICRVGLWKNRKLSGSDGIHSA